MAIVTSWTPEMELKVLQEKKKKMSEISLPRASQIIPFVLVGWRGGHSSSVRE